MVSYTEPSYPTRWKSWFAWYPVCITPHYVVWLERIEKRKELFVVCYDRGTGYEYIVEPKTQFRHLGRVGPRSTVTSDQRKVYNETGRHATR